jgi:hypothetical protein
VISLLPANYSVFVWAKNQVQPGFLFPVLMVNWTTALLGFAFNNVYIDKSIFDKNARKMSGIKTYLPSLLSIPAFFSFVWFMIRWYKGDVKH